jgi:hypothetical protein
LRQLAPGRERNAFQSRSGTGSVRCRSAATLAIGSAEGPSSGRDAEPHPRHAQEVPVIVAAVLGSLPLAEVASRRRSAAPSATAAVAIGSAKRSESEDMHCPEPAGTGI